MADSNRVVVASHEPSSRHLLAEYRARLAYDVARAVDGETLRSVFQIGAQTIALPKFGPVGKDGTGLACGRRQRRKIGVMVPTGAVDFHARIVGAHCAADSLDT